MSTIYNPDGVVEHRASYTFSDLIGFGITQRPRPSPPTGDAFTPEELARVRRARSSTDEALSLERDARLARLAVNSTPCTCKGSHVHHDHPDAPSTCHSRCEKRQAQDRADRLQRMEDMVTGRRAS